MKAVGIIVEYNPLHNGHLYHLAETKKEAHADIVIAVMSGNVVQRGEFSLVDKFTKTRWALEAGIDLVIELPGLYTLQSADIFARTSVSLLNHLNVDSLCFGSESGNLQDLNAVVDILDEPRYQKELKNYLDQGFSYPTSSHKAMTKMTDKKEHITPNNILAIQYLRALKELASPIKPITITRIATGYYDEIDTHSQIQSATAIRKLSLQKENFRDFVPSYVANDLMKLYPITLEDFYHYFQYCFASYTQVNLQAIFGFEEGLENRFLNVDAWDSVEHLVELLATPRYTLSRIKRTLMHMLLRTEKKDLTRFDVEYIRVLGMSSKGQAYLNQIKHTLEIPLITKLPQERSLLLDYELRISKFYDLIVKRDLFREEFKPVIIL